MNRIFFTLLISVIAKPLAAASFDCETARARIEKTVCADAELSHIPRNLELPVYPALLWAIAPLPELKAAPRVAPHPLQVEGKLDFGCPECGYFLRADGGKTYVLIHDVFLGGATATQLAVLRETSREARLVARGFARTDDPRQAGFDNQHCVYLHQAP